MRHGLLLAGIAACVSSSGIALAQPPAAHHSITAGSGMRGHFVMRPRGWVWGGPGWWGGSYQRPVSGYIMPSFWLGPDYAVPDWAGYGFAEPGQGRRWVRYYDDAVLVDGRGMIYDSVRDVPWGRYSHGPVPAYVGNAPDSAPPPYGPAYGDVYANDDEVTWQGGSAGGRERQVWAWPNQTTSAQGNAVVMVPPGTTTTIMVQPQMVTTTTISYEDVPAPAWKARPRAKVKYRSSAPPRVIGRVPIKKG
jgi:Predicted integral membrane protein